MTSTYSQLFGAAGGQLSGITQYELVTSSRVVRALRDGTLDVFCSGGSGSGAVVIQAGFAGGAGAGEAAVKRGIAVKAGDEFTISIGAGGASVTRSTSGFTSGNAGSPTTVSGPGVSITVNGGSGAPASASKPIAGGAGGTGGTGGDVHLAGGDGGSVLNTTSAYAAAGGGAVAALPTPPAVRRGGNVDSTTSAAVLSAGAGVGGVGGSAINGATVSSTPSGGGSGGPGANASDTVVQPGGANFLGRRVQSSPTEYIQSFYSWGIDVFGGGSSGGSQAGPGGGGGITVPMPGVFGGGGVRYNGSPEASTFGTGVSALNPTAVSMTSGAGGNGVAILIFKEA